MTTATLPALTQSANGPGDVPDWVHLCPSGAFAGIKGDTFRLADPEGVIRRSMARGKFVLDENHSTDLAAPKGKPAPARGWVTRMESRADGLWGLVDWTPPGRALMADRSYLGISPVIQSAPGGDVLRILRASLTNAPDLTLVTMHSQLLEKDMDIAKLRKALGLPDTATEDDVLAAIGQSRSAVTLHSSVATVLGVDAGADNKAVLNALQARLKNAGIDADTGRVAELETQIEALKAQASRDKVVGLLDQAAKEGAAITEKQRDDLITLHSSNARLATDIIGGLPRTVLNDTKVTRHSAAGAAGENRGSGVSDAAIDTMARTFGLTADEIRKGSGHGASV